ncbi:hypothetical protein ERC79_08525 [Rhodococcus sp. ABRD24]|uniref:hypothetical protein n=1 Tax=Rhodococcus sp. ABRD24 TaxID=2507582 RepID=UPI0010392D23|nr:hypothetical protein [Rhodococcus sp. ABRD24]QBJ96011.1 hypothetical protein ERC79_08525 [Rhodococcus sp. ABRD24]
MSLTAALTRMWAGALISLVILVGLLAMHGLASTGSTGACHGNPALAVADSPAVDHHGPAARSAPATEFAGATCMATLPRLVGVSNPLLIGFIALALLGSSIGLSSLLQSYCRWGQWRAPPTSGVQVLRLECVLRT